jgi:uncharacterized membrane protein
MQDLVARFTSRKFLLALVGIVVVFFKDTLHLTQEAIDAIVNLIIAFTAAEGVADAVTRYTNIPEVEEDVPASGKKR